MPVELKYDDAYIIHLKNIPRFGLPNSNSSKCTRISYEMNKEDPKDEQSLTTHLPYVNYDIYSLQFRFYTIILPRQIIIDRELSRFRMYNNMN